MRFFENQNTLQQLPTPFYYYNMELLRKNLSLLKKTSHKFNFKIHYALKANANSSILHEIQKSGFGADCGSGNEILKAIEEDFNPKSIVFAGVGKTDHEINLALDNNIGCFNCESIDEIIVINQLSESKNKRANIALRINPNIDAKTHSFITTGLNENKFGINTDDLNTIIIEIQKFKNIHLTGIHLHIGSQITDLNVYKNLCIKINEIQDWFEEQNIPIKHINIGGGLGIDYHNPDKNPLSNFENFFTLLDHNLKTRPGQVIHIEPGRSVVGQCGTLFTRVLFVKKGQQKDFVIVDAGFTELLRPALYQSYHKIQNITSTKTIKPYDIVGPICESSDSFGSGILLPETQRGDLIAIRTTGAYGEVMSSRYNLRNPAQAYYSDKLTKSLIKKAV